jgi:hypothetical protein
MAPVESLQKRAWLREEDLLQNTYRSVLRTTIWDECQDEWDPRTLPTSKDDLVYAPDSLLWNPELI